MRELFKFDPDFDPASDLVRPNRIEAHVHSTAPQSTLVQQLFPDDEVTRAFLSQVSQKSLVARFMDLDPIAKELFEERAAILQYEAGLSRPDAETTAFRLVMQAYRDAEK